MSVRSGGVFRFALLLAFASIAAFGQCTFTISPTAPFVDSAAQGGIVLQVTASAQTCAWTASSTGFASAGAPASGTGNGSVTYSVTANTTGVDRTATVTVAGLVVTITQRWTAAIFSDVSPSISYFNAANLMSQNAITVGCATTPTLQYCGEANVTRRQMAVFIVRTILGGGPNANNFNYSTTPYFTDVPATDVNFRFVQKLRDMGVTAGCSATAYCPDANVTRDQMAVFIVRARLGSTAAYTFNPTPFFTDVPADYQPANFFRAIQKLREIGITAGCTATAYCPASFVTRGAMAIFLTRAGFNTLFSATTPLITSVSPNSGIAGSALNVALTGLNTNFVQGTTTVTANNGVIAGTPTVTDATHLSVLLTIPQGTVLGPISLTAVTGTQEATLPNGFTVGLGDPLPTITSFSPASGPIGTAVTLTGTGLVSSSGTPADVRLPLLGGGVGSAPLTASSVTSLSFVIPSTATTGNITVAGSSGSATSATAFTVTPSSTFTIAAGPSAANLIAGEEATYTVTLASANGFTGLAQLTLTGLPAGVTAVLAPAQLAVGQQSLITLKAPATQAASTSTLVFRATATVDGIPLSLSTSVVLNVTPITTTLRGRTVVDNNTQTALAGVIVTMLGKDGSGNNSGCTGSTISDASGNFALTGLSAACIGPQLAGFNGDHVTAPAGKYAGVDLIFTLVGSKVVVSPVLVHLPRIDNVETFMVQQNSTVNQTYTYTSIPGVSVTVYPGTVLTKPDGTQPNPFPLAAIEVAVDRLPDPMPATTATVAVFIVAFQPANTKSSKAVAVWFPNSLNTPPGTNVPLMTLDPTRGRPVPYGTGTISNDGKTIIPDVDPATGALNHRFGIVNFDWHGPAVQPPPGNNPGPPGGPKPWGADPVDLSSGLFVISDLDMDLKGMFPIRFIRTLRNASALIGPFGLGGDHSFNYHLNTITPQTAAVVNLVMPDQNQYPFNRQPDDTLTNTTIAELQGAVMTTASDGKATLKWLDGSVMKFSPGTFGVGSPLSSWADRNGNTLTFTRDAAFNLTRITDASGRNLNFVVDGQGRITSMTDAINRSVTYTYEAGGRLATVTHPDGAKWTYGYSGTGNLTTVTDPRNVVIVNNTYDANSRVIRQVQSDGTVFTFAYTLINQLVPTSPIQQTVITDQLGRTTTYRFNFLGYVTGVTDALGNTRNLDRQSGTNNLMALSGNAQCMVCGIPQRGDMSFTYDLLGNRLSITNAAGGSESFQYAAGTNLPTAVTNALGQTSTFTYDSRGNVVSIADPNGGTKQFLYDGAGRVKSTTDEAGNVATLSYDSIGNLVSITDANGNISQFSYDGVSRLIAAKDAKGQTTALQYDAKDRLIRQTNANGQVVQFTYDVLGNMATMTDPKGGVVTFTYDVNERLVSVKDRNNKTASYTYDLAGNLASATDRRGQTTTYAYDALNRRVQDTFADGATVKRQFDAAGRLVNQTDSVAGVFKYTYDVNGNRSQMTTPFGSVNYTRDAVFKVTARQVTGQPAVNYTYNSRGLVTQIAIGTNTVAFAYDVRDHISGITRSNGVTTADSFDAAGNLTGVAHNNGSTVFDTQAIAYDSLHNVASITRSIGQPLTTQSSTATYNAGNHLTAFGSRTLSNDNNGNRLTDVSAAGSTSFTWDARNRLTAMTIPGGFTVAYLYDPEGNLIRRRVTGASTDTIDQYLVDETTNVIYQARLGGEQLNMLSGFRLDQQFGVVGSAGTVGFALHDYIGNVVGNTNASGALAGQNRFEPFGETSATGAALPFAFGGRLQVAPNLYNFRARYYDPSTGSFISEDPIGVNADFNFSRYALNNPASRRDPTGLISGGLYAGGIADAGIVAGGGAQATSGVGGFYNGTDGFSGGAWTSTGGFVGVPGSGANWDSGNGFTGGTGSGNGGAAVGAVASIGGGAWISNAGNAGQLAGPFNQVNLNVGIGPIQGGISFAWSGATDWWNPFGGTWIISVSPPFAGLTAGAGASFYKTNTGWTGSTNGK